MRRADSAQTRWASNVSPMSTRVTVVIRTKDRPDFLARALGDVASQSYRDWEVIVANDGGDRGGVDTVVAKSGLADQTSVLDVPRPGGRCAAANTGIRAAAGEYVVLHDDDDLWDVDFLARTVALLDVSPDAAGVVTATEIVYEERRDDRWQETSRAPFWAGMTGVSFTSLLEVNRAVPISFLYRRRLHDEVGWYDESLDTVEDWEFYLRVTARHPITFLGGKPLAYWTQRPSVTGADGNSMFEMAGQHERDDLDVRDRALREWVSENGPGLPLYLASIEKRLRSEQAAALADLRRSIVEDIYARHPIWRRLRRLRRS